MDALDRIRPPAMPGDRVVVRYRLPDGRATDVIGWLGSVGADQLSLRDQEGLQHIIGRGTIVAARRAPAARGGRDPMRTSPAELEQIALPGWLALSEPLGEWTLRAGGGFTVRANSCLAVGDPGLPTAAAAERIRTFSDRHGIAARAQVIDGSEPEGQLRSLGWQDTYVPTDVLVARLNDLLGSAQADQGAHDEVRVSESLTERWERAYALSRPNSADPQVLRSILGGHPPRAFAGVEQDGRLIAIGRAHLSADWMGAASIWTAPEYRQRGWATQVLTALGHWAARRGARNAYLQVATDNESGHRAYGRVGFRLHHHYRYLAPPD